MERVPKPKNIINVIDNIKSLVSHDIPDGITCPLENWLPCLNPKGGQVSIYVPCQVKPSKS